MVTGVQLAGRFCEAVAAQADAPSNEETPIAFPASYEVACSIYCDGQKTSKGPGALTAPWVVAHPEGEPACIDLGGRYELELDQKGSRILLRNQLNDEEDCLWSAGVQYNSFGLPETDRSLTYRLLDGTKITISFDDEQEASPTLKEITITREERAIQIRGLNIDEGKVLEIDQSIVGGRLLDWAIEDGQLFQEKMLYERIAWDAVGNAPVEQPGMRDSLTGAFSRMLGLFLLTGLVVQRNSEAGEVGAGSTLIEADPRARGIQLSQRDDSGLDVNVNGETISLAREESEQLIVRSGEGDFPVVILGEVTAEIRIESGDGDDAIAVDGGKEDDLLVGTAALLDVGQPRSPLTHEEQSQLQILETGLEAVDTEQILDDFVGMAIRAQPGQGVQAAQVEALVYQSEIDRRWSGIYQLRESVVLLLADGWAYLDLGLPPENFNVDASRQLEPGKWTRWRQKEEAYLLLDTELGEWRSLQGDLVSSVRDDLTLNFRVSRSDVSGFPLMGTVTTREAGFVFFEDGRFEAYSSSLSTIEGLSSFQSFASFRDSEGSSSTVTGSFDATSGELPGIAVSGRSELPDEGADWRGSYRIQGNTIELCYDSGRISRELFFVDGDGDLFIGDRIYWRDE